MKIKSPLLDKSAGLLATLGVRAWMGTLNYKALFYDPTVDPVHDDCRGQKLYLFWHEYILVPLAVRGHCNLAMLLSRHQDAEILSHAARYMGFGTIRGSTARGGVTALREMLRRSQHMHLTMVPDGPRGPRRVMAPGPIYLASRLGLPLVLLGLGLDRPWRANSWDRFAIPRPFSRVRAIVSPPLYLPSGLDRDGLEHYRQQVEHLLNYLTGDAERWAEGGEPRLGEEKIYAQAGSRLARRLDRPEDVLRRPTFGPAHAAGRPGLSTPSNAANGQ